MKLKFIYSFLLTFICLNINGQNLITVPFNNGFVGDNSANNNSTNAYYTAGANGVGLGWTNLQFAQNSTSNIFTTQGNDIIGSVLITDATGSEKTINGFIKWRAPSGQVTTMCFQPETGTNVTLATNGTNGTSTYIITDTKYIGLTFNGKTLSITGVPGTVSGNAATSGLLSELNAYLATFGKLSVADVSVNEGAGTATVTVTLSASSTNVITVAYTTSNGTATAGQDYTATSGTLTFTAGQTSRTFTISIINDITVESTETINITLSDPTNASILDGAGVVSIVDNDNCSLSSPTASVTVQPTCAVPTGTIVFTTQSGVEYSIDGTTYQSSATF
ncbi:MAG: hypothetical protein KBC58_11460, partial [Flavobacterium sp.]|nr:hypothetical protein [Flavobacterium sp.]